MYCEAAPGDDSDFHKYCTALRETDGRPSPNRLEVSMTSTTELSSTTIASSTNGEVAFLDLNILGPGFWDRFAKHMKKWGTVYLMVGVLIACIVSVICGWMLATFGVAACMLFMFIWAFALGLEVANARNR